MSGRFLGAVGQPSGTSTSFPRTWPVSLIQCASAARANGNVYTWITSLPSASSAAAGGNGAAPPTTSGDRFPDVHHRNRGGERDIPAPVPHSPNPAAGPGSGPGRCFNDPMSTIDFARSERSRLGLEWEIACVDRRSGELSPAAPDLLDRLGPATEFPHVTGELLTNTVEIVSAPHRRAADAVADLTRMVEQVHRLAEPMGVQLMSSGTHPFSQWFQQQVTPGNDRYATLIDRTRWWGRQMMIWGVHVHVAVDDRDKVLPIIDGLLTYLPHFQALSASSPFWAGETTGYASNRALMFQQLPTAGLPPQLSRWSEYEALVDDLTHTGVIDVLSELRWDIRPSPRWGTIEVRTFDGISTANEIGAVAALTQCLVEHFSRELDAGRGIPALQPWFVRENKWRTARYGMDAIIIRDPAGDERLVTDDLRALVPALEPVAADLGCTADLMDVLEIVDHGASYQRQLRVAQATGGSLKAVVSSLVRELLEGRPTRSRPAPATSHGTTDQSCQSN